MKLAAKRAPNIPTVFVLNNLIAWFVHNKIAAGMLMLVIASMGVWSITDQVYTEIFPDFRRDIININVEYPGATPAEIEEIVLIPIEEAISGLENIKNVTSLADEGWAKVKIELEKGEDSAGLLEDVKARVDAIHYFPRDMYPPVYSTEVFRREVTSVVVSGYMDKKALHDIGSTIKNELLGMPEIGIVEMLAVPEREIAIEVTQNTLNKYGLSFGELLAAIRQSSIDYSAGTIESDGQIVLLRSYGKARNAKDFENVVVRTAADGAILRLGDISTIKDGFREQALSMQYDGREGLILQVFRSGKQSALDIGEKVKDYVADRNLTLPSNVQMSIWRDRSHMLKSRLDTLLTSAWQGGVLIFLMLAVFLRTSIAFWVCMGIPVSFLGALTVIPELGVSINVVSLFAFILVLGIVVDDAIITSENIYTHMKFTKNPQDAAINGTQEISTSVTFGLLTTVAVFMPFLFIGGLRGPIFAQIPLVIIPVLIFSWVESKLILPSHLLRVRRENETSQWIASRLRSGISRLLDTLRAQYYIPLLRTVLSNRYLVLAGVVAIALIILGYVASGRHGFVFFPRVDAEIARATLIMDPGSAASVTNRNIEILREKAELLRQRHVDGNGESVIKHIMIAKGWMEGGDISTKRIGQPEVGQVNLEPMALT